MSAKPIVDLHCHPSLKPTNNSKITNMWDFAKNPTTSNMFKGIVPLKPRKWAIDSFVKSMAKFTQSNLKSCYEGNNKVLFFAIYPPERPFLMPSRPFKGTTVAQQLILSAIFGLEPTDKNLEVDNKVIRAIAGFSKDQTQEYLDQIYDDDAINYFDDFLKEYKIIEDANDSQVSVDGFTTKAKFKLVKNFEEYKAIKHNEIAGIITVEGAHVLGNYPKKDLLHTESIDKMDPGARAQLKQSFIDNIKTLKDPAKIKYTPFFITFSHHFNNLISGHAKSFKDAKNGITPGFSDVFNQSLGLNKGITAFGKELIEKHLLSRDNGKRMLIDTKHMSIDARIEYTAIVKRLWRTKQDRVPIICSHTAINGIPTYQEAKSRKDTNRLDARSYVSRWDINITNEDITDIFDSKGIIGVCLHDGRMPGGKFNKLVKVESRAMGSSIRVQRLHTQMFLTNVFHIARVNLEHIRNTNANSPDQISEKEAWNTVCLGSDFDGIIDPFDNFDTAATLSGFRARCKDAIEFNFNPIEERKRAKILHVGPKNSRAYSKVELDDIMMGFSPEELVDKIFTENMLAFMEKFFTDEYLKK